MISICPLISRVHLYNLIIFMIVTVVADMKPKTESKIIGISLIKIKIFCLELKCSHK